MQVLPEVVNKIVSLYFELMDKHLPGLMEGFYIYGSAALNDFYPDKSDIDFITVVSRKPGHIDVEKLQMVHGLIRMKFRKSELNGIYVLLEQLGKTKDETEPVTYYYNSRIHDEGYFEINDVTWYQLKNKAITLKGTPASELNFHIDWKCVLKEMHENMNTYWKRWIKKSSGFSYGSLKVLLFSKCIEWGVLGITRQYYSFIENDITSKSSAGEWVLTKVPVEYHKILQEALNIRSGKNYHYTSKYKRKKDALAYMRFIIEESNRRLK
ncbi:MAG: DUF4111 domain-containing protein [Ignavibacteriae bacterium]|nr:MAG: DUF4111 domain-containing protein [Ignavibacteriota bacterium]